MRIAYIAPYQGAELLKRRPSLLNLSLAATVKVQLIAELLFRSAHEVEIISQGEVVERKLKFYTAFREPQPFHPKIPVYYASALPVRFLNGYWSSRCTLNLFKQRHRAAPFDLVIMYNLKLPQIACAEYAMRRFGLPVILEYEDDAFVDVGGRAEGGLRASMIQSKTREMVDSVSGGIAVSPYLQSQLPGTIPKLMLRGVVGDEVVNASHLATAERKNWVVFSGTHYRSKGLEPMIEAWRKAAPAGWELHIAGQGELTAKLEKMAEGIRSVVFHGLLSRQENARLLSQAKIGMNPHDVSETPGNVFAFKIIEYLAAGEHVITTRMGPLESEIESGITYMADNKAETISMTLQRVIQERLYERKADKAAQETYGPAGVAKSLDRLLQMVMSGRIARNGTLKKNGTSFVVKSAVKNLLGEKNVGRLEYLVRPNLHELGGPLNGQTYRRRIFSDIMKQIPFKAIVETGTFQGTTTSFFASFGLPVYSVEVNPRSYGYASLRLLSQRNRVRLFHDDSSNFLRDLAKNQRFPKRDVFFYLDAHWEDHLPLAEELEIIFANWTDAVVMVDDFKVPGSDYGYDDYGPGKALNMEYLKRLEHLQLISFFPAAGAEVETGRKRGCVVLCRGKKEAELLTRIESLTSLA